MSRPRRSAGFTLIELMISLAIGIMVVGSGFALYLQTSKVRDSTQAELTLQQSSYFLNQSIRQLVNQAGYRPLQIASSTIPIFPVNLPEVSFPEVSGEWEKGQFIKATSNGFSFRFEGASDSTGAADGSLVDCNGDIFAEGEIGDIHLTIEDGTLICTSAGVAVEMIGEDDGISVENFAVSWGIDVNKDNSVDEYRASSAGIASGEKLLAVRFALLLSTTNDIRKSNLPYTFNGVQYASTDSKLRREFITTTHLKH